MMDSRKACEEFLAASAKVAVTPAKKECMRKVVEGAGVKVDNSMRLLSPMVRQDQLEKIFVELSEMAVLKILAKRVFRSNGIHL